MRQFAEILKANLFDFFAKHGTLSHPLICYWWFRVLVITEWTQTKIIKKLSGGIRTALAQYRELAAFSQFASDLDDATKAQLDHGERVTELMKQKQYSPLSVAEMSVVLYAANEGHLEGVDVAKISDFEAALLSYMNVEHAELMKTINTTGDYSDSIGEQFKAALDEFKETQTY